MSGAMAEGGRPGVQKPPKPGNPPYQRLFKIGNGQNHRGLVGLETVFFELSVRFSEKRVKNTLV